MCFFQLVNLCLCGSSQRGQCHSSVDEDVFKNRPFYFVMICYRVRMFCVLTEQLLLLVERQCPVLIW